MRNNTPSTRGFARSFQIAARAIVLPIAVMSVVGCSAIVDADKSKLGALPVPCNVGKTAACPCPDGTKSTQLCNNLARFDSCMCQGHGGKAGQSGAAGHAGGAGVAGHAGAGTAGKAGATGTAGKAAAGRGAAGH